MTIAEARGKCKGLLARIPRDILTITILVLSASASFALGYLAGQEQGSGREGSAILEESSAEIDDVVAVSGQFVASKNGTKYYPSDCAGADRISDANKVWFASVAAAVSAGYAPAANCK